MITSTGRRKIADALRARAITVLDDESRSVKVKNHSIDLVGIPNARVESARSKQLLTALVPERPSIVLTHDPMWFANVPRGPHLTLAVHTHGGQISLPVRHPCVGPTGLLGSEDSISM